MMQQTALSSKAKTFNPVLMAFDSMKDNTDATVLGAELVSEYDPQLTDLFNPLFLKFPELLTVRDNGDLAITTAKNTPTTKRATIYAAITDATKKSTVYKDIRARTKHEFMVTRGKSTRKTQMPVMISW